MTAFIWGPWDGREIHVPDDAYAATVYVMDGGDPFGWEGDVEATYELNPHTDTARWIPDS